jgi:hypothetical protein
MLSNNPVRVPLPEGKRNLVYVFSAFVPVPYVTTNLRTPTIVDHVVRAWSTINHDSTYVVVESINIGGLSLTPSKTSSLYAAQFKFESLHLFGLWLNGRLLEAM